MCQETSGSDQHDQVSGCFTQRVLNDVYSPTVTFKTNLFRRPRGVLIDLPARQSEEVCDMINGSS